MGIGPVGKLAPAWERVLEGSQLHYVREAPGLLCIWGRDDLPSEHHWVEDAAESLAARLDDPALSAEDAAREMWHALLRDHLAYLHLQLWKVHEMVEAAVHLLNSRNIIAACGPARSALESAQVSYLLQDRQRRALMQLAGRESSPQDLLALYAETLERALYGRTTAVGEHAKLSTATVQDRFLKLCKDKETLEVLPDVYALLCDAVHPSANGHQGWWGDAAVSSDGQNIRHLRFGSANSLMMGLGEAVVWAIAWSTAWTLRIVDLVMPEIEQTLRGT